jgi:hypothetical protein
MPPKGTYPKSDKKIKEVNLNLITNVLVTDKNIISRRHSRERRKNT